MTQTSEAELIKRLATAHANLRAARDYLSSQDHSLKVLDERIELGSVSRKLNAAMLQELTYQLVALGEKELPRAGFWRSLEVAAQALPDHALAGELRARFLSAVADYKGEHGMSGSNTVSGSGANGA